MITREPGKVVDGGTAPLLEVENLSVTFRGRSGDSAAVAGLSLSVAPGETVAVVGESGSGKSQAALAIMGLSPKGARIGGEIRLDGQNLVGLGEAGFKAVRGRRIGMIFQEPMTSLDPLVTVGRQIIRVLRYHQGLDRQAAHARAIDLLRDVEMPEPEIRFRSYPHELSGGQRQRIMIALALANNPDLLIADEPTTSLDVTVAAGILKLLGDLKRRRGMAILFITHDLNIVRRFADRVTVMSKGRAVETAATDELFARPRSTEASALIAAEPPPLAPRPVAGAPVVLEARNVSVVYPARAGLFAGRQPPVVAVDSAAVTLRAGRTVGLVGESGSGKSTLGRAILRLGPATGSVRLEDRELAPLSRAQMRPLRRRMQVVFQDPFGSLSPRLTVGEIVAEGLIVHSPELSPGERDRRAAAVLAEVGIDPDTRHRYPHEFSGGQRQRIAIARAIILSPTILVLDEPTSALDRTVQRQVVELLLKIQRERATAFLFISHDLAVVRALADEILVMKDGRILEAGLANDVFMTPRSAYTAELVAGSGVTSRAIDKGASRG